MIKRLIYLLLPLCFLVVSMPAEQITKQKLPSVIYERPDIVVEKIKVTSQPSQKPGIVYLKIEFWLGNKSPKKTRCCPTEAGIKAWKDSPATNKLFNVRVYSRSYPQGRYSMIGGTTTELNPFESNYRCQIYKYFNIGQTIQIKVVADPENWINEKNENNNVKTIIWPLRVKKIFRK